MKLVGCHAIPARHSLASALDSSPHASVSTASWKLRVHGLVDREIELTFDDLLTREMIETDVTISCVSNEVGGDLVGNARWLGCRLDDLLATCEEMQRLWRGEVGETAA